MKHSLTCSIIVWATLGAAACSGSSGSPTEPTSTPASTTNPPTTNPVSGTVTWNYTGTTWTPTGTAPACPSPMNLAVPVDLARVTSVLYPGQTRGGDYKPHGGFRFDGPGQTNDVVVSLPMTSTIYRGTRFLVDGEIQYGFDFISECGIMQRIGHLRDLTPRFAALAATLPAAAEGDSRFTTFSGQVATAGEAIATATGIRANTNVFVDWGVYDLRQRNASSGDPAWFAAHPGEIAPYAVCWFDLLSSSNAAIVRSLPPADPTSGRSSDFCR
jgi:hypothetical protein